MKTLDSIINAEVPILILYNKIYPFEFLSYLQSMKLILGSVEAISHNASICKPRVINTTHNEHK